MYKWNTYKAYVENTGSRVSTVYNGCKIYVTAREDLIKPDWDRDKPIYNMQGRRTYVVDSGDDSTLESFVGMYMQCAYNEPSEPPDETEYGLCEKVEIDDMGGRVKFYFENPKKKIVGPQKGEFIGVVEDSNYYAHGDNINEELIWYERID